MGDSSDFTKSWRYKVGLGLIIFGHLVLLGGIVAPTFGLVGAAAAGGMVLGGEIISMCSIVFLGKEGFLTIKSKVFKFVKAGYAGPVSAARHAWGITLFVTNLVTSYLIFAFVWTVVKQATPENPFPTVLGINFDEQSGLILALFLIGELSFLISIYVLGADWWERFRNIFVYNK